MPHIKKSHSDKNINKHFYLDDDKELTNVEYNRSVSVKSDTRNEASDQGVTETFLPPSQKNGELHGANGDLNSVEEYDKGDNKKCCATLRNWSVIQLLG